MTRPPTGIEPNFQPTDRAVDIVLPSLLALFKSNWGCKIKFVGSLLVNYREYKVAGSRSAPKFSKFAAFMTGNNLVCAPLNANAT